MENIALENVHEEMVSVYNRQTKQLTLQFLPALLALPGDVMKAHVMREVDLVLDAVLAKESAVV